MNIRAFLTVVCLISPCAGCGDRIVVPLRTCIVAGSDLAAQSPAQRDSELEPVFAKMNDFWHSKADIHFLPLGTSDNNIQVVIPDPAAPPTPGVIGMPGDIDIGSRGESPEMAAAHESCIGAWPPRDRGIVVLIAHNLVSSRLTATQGANPGHKVTRDRNNGKDLCIAPRNLAVDDVTSQYVVVPEPSRFRLKPGGSDREGSLEGVLAHELGHALLLGHGDGLDNDQNGVLPPSPGPRLFDEGCDPTEFQNIDEAPGAKLTSLMAPSGTLLGGLTPLQRELARDAAALVPGSATGLPFWPW